MLKQHGGSKMSRFKFNVLAEFNKHDLLLTHYYYVVPVITCNNYLRISLNRDARSHMLLYHVGKLKSHYLMTILLVQSELKPGFSVSHVYVQNNWQLIVTYYICSNGIECVRSVCTLCVQSAEIS